MELNGTEALKRSSEYCDCQPCFFGTLGNKQLQGRNILKQSLKKSMNNREIHFHSYWLVDTLLENECVLVHRSCFIKTCFPAQSLPWSINKPIVLCRSENMLNLLNQWMRSVRDVVKAVHWTVMLLHSIGFSKHCPLDYDTINQVSDIA